jgi:hypothetical protein
MLQSGARVNDEALPSKVLPAAVAIVTLLPDVSFLFIV